MRAPGLWSAPSKQLEPDGSIPGGGGDVLENLRAHKGYTRFGTGVGKCFARAPQFVQVFPGSLLPAFTVTLVNVNAWFAPVSLLKFLRSQFGLLWRDRRISKLRQSPKTFGVGNWRGSHKSPGTLVKNMNHTTTPPVWG